MSLPGPCRPSRKPVGFALLALLPMLGFAPAESLAQDVNIPYTAEYLENRLNSPVLEVLDMERARPLIEWDRSAEVMIGGGDGEPPLHAHWKPVRPPGSGQNNEPRYEMAAYEFQKLFLDEADYVVPPKVLRSIPLSEYVGVREESRPTIRDTESLIVILSYWLQQVTNIDPFEEGRLLRDPEYARRWGNANILTHLIEHKDSNLGNLLISIDPRNPRVFSVDNDIAWRSSISDQGAHWRRLHVDALPQDAIDRLRALTRDDLDRALGVVWEFAIEDGHLVPTERGPNLDPGRGVRVTDGRVQFGLTEREINDTENRIRSLLEQVERGRITLF